MFPWGPRELRDGAPQSSHDPGLPQHQVGLLRTSHPLLCQPCCHDLVSSSSQNSIRDITDSLIQQCLDKKVGMNAATQIPKEKIVSLVNDLFGAGILPTFPQLWHTLSGFLQLLLSDPSFSNTRQPVWV